MNDPIELPSLEEVEQMEQRRSQAVESLQISDGFVKCQRLIFECCYITRSVQALSFYGLDASAIYLSADSFSFCI